MSRRKLTAVLVWLRQAWSAGRLRSAAAAILGLIGGLVLLLFVNHLYPIGGWLLHIVASMWLWQLYLAAAFVAAGDLLISRYLRLRDLAPLPRLALAAPAGAMVFAVGMFLGGFLSLFGPTFAVAWPATMLLVATAIHGVREWPAWARAVRAPAGPTPWMTAVARVFGVLAVFVIYLGVFSPEAVNYDAAWSHLVVAQDYAREGRIVSFQANWPATLPHLASIFYTWAFLVPGLGSGAVRWMMALHTEFAFLLWTVLGVGVGVQLFAERPARGAWVAFFLFPGIFVYDNNLGGAADHVLAFFAAPALIAAVRGAETLNPRWWALFGIIAAGGLLTKFQSAYVMLPTGLLLASGLVREIWRRRVARSPAAGAVATNSNPWAEARWLWQAPLAVLTALVITTAPHFICNWVFYRNPIYPMAQRFFTGSRPYLQGAELLAGNIISHWGTKPPGHLVERLGRALELFATFSFRPHAGFSGNLPVVGSLFTLSLPLVLLVGGARRVRVAVAIAAAAVFLWAFTYWVDRNLQGFVPLLAIATCVLLVRTWELGRLARVGVVVLVGAQMAWSSDHFLNGVDRMGSALVLIRSGYDGRAPERFKDFRRPFVELSAALPAGARVLMHSIHGSLGINRETLLDWPGFQGLIDPRDTRTPRELYDRYRALGVTHIIYHPGLHPSPMKQDDVVFGAFRTRYRDITRQFGHLYMFPLPADPPPVEPAYKVLVKGIEGYDDGIYRVQDLATLEGLPPGLQTHYTAESPLIPGQVEGQLDQVQAILLGKTAVLEPAAATKTTAQFQQVVAYSGFQLQVRR